VDLYVEVSQVVIVRNSLNAGHSGRGISKWSDSSDGGNSRLSHQPFGLFDDSFGKGHVVYCAREQARWVRYNAVRLWMGAGESKGTFFRNR